MIRYLLPLLSCLLVQPGIADDWKQWRGPDGNGHAVDQDPPIKWDSRTNVIWKSKIPGRGHSSPVILNGRIYLTTAYETEPSQSVLCLDQSSGRILWQKIIHRGNFPEKIHLKNTHASPTLATDGYGLFVCFYNDQRISLTKLSLMGEVLWQKEAGQFKPHYPFGFAASPTIWKNLVIVVAESEQFGFIVAYDRESGKKIWRTERSSTSFSSPIVGHVGMRDQLLLSGDSSVSGFDPANGRKLWSAPAIWQVSCGTLVWNKDLVFASGGFPKAQTLCVKADGSGEVVWQNRVKCYEQSMLYHDGFLYGISDSGIGYCWRAADGQEMWKARMKGPVSCSPILANGRIYYSSERGTTFVFAARSDKFERLAENKLGDSAFATPAFCDDKIYTRIGIDEDGTRQEYLYCLGEK